MKYKAFQDFYKELEIKHLILHEYNGKLISPPFATELCKDYSKIAVLEGTSVSYIDLDLPPVTSKFNALAQVDDSLWLIPYGIWDKFNIIVELNNTSATYHAIDKPGKGQFYSIASNNNSACSFPLGYEGTNYIIYINKYGLQTVEYTAENVKAHMGTVWCNGRYWSMPRGDEPGYTNLLGFDGTDLETFKVPVDASITRKFTDIVPIDNKLYSLPYGETEGLTDVVEFDTDTHQFTLYPLDVPDFPKKFNTQIVVGNSIIGLPYGDEDDDNSNYGVIFNLITKQSISLDIGLNFGGKYRYRSGISVDNYGLFFPTGTPSCPIIKVYEDGTIEKKFYEDTMFGRPILYNNAVHVIGYDITTKISTVYKFNKDLTCNTIAAL